MRRMTVWRAVVLGALAVLMPGGAFGQGALQSQIGGGIGTGVTGSGGVDYAPPANGNLWLPLYSTNPALGGLYLDGGFLYMEQSNPIKSQLVAVRGFVDVDGSVALRGAGAFVGSRANALDTNQVTGPQSFQPGFTVGGGYRFSDGSVLSIDYWYFTTAFYHADATLVPQGLQIGQNQAESFLTAFVFNFPAQYAGPPFKVITGLPNALYGIWNGASAMTESFRQLWWQLEATYRVPIYDTECFRVSGLVGPRYFRIQDTYQWTTTDLGGPFPGIFFEQPTWSAIYNNIVSNDMYGVHAGVSAEWYLGCGFAAMLTVQGAAFVNVVREETIYELGLKDATPQAKRSVRQYTLVPEIQATPAIQWYPWEGIQIRFAYDFMAFANTVAAPRPVTFDYSGLDPGYERVFRFFNGFTAAIAFVF